MLLRANYCLICIFSIHMLTDYGNAYVASRYSTIRIPQKSSTLIKMTQSKDKSVIQMMSTFLPFFSFCLASGGIAFQVFVLYPWHEELSSEFLQLKESIVRLDNSLNKISPVVTAKEMLQTRDNNANRQSISTVDEMLHPRDNYVSRQFVIAKSGPKAIQVQIN